MKFQDDISNVNIYIHTYIHTYIHSDKPKPKCPPLFQSLGHKKEQGKLHMFLNVRELRSNKLGRKKEKSMMI